MTRKVTHRRILSFSSQGGQSPHGRRQMRLSWILGLVLLVSLGPCLVQARVNPLATTTSSSSSAAALTQQRFTLSEPERVTTGPFSIKLAPTPLKIEGHLLDELYVILQQCLLEYIKEETINGSLRLLYFVITDIQPQETEGNVSTLSIGEGAATFDVISTASTSSTTNGNNNVAVPASAQIEAWLQTAVDTKLVERLEQTDFYYVQEARFVSIADSANDNNNGPDGIRDELIGVTPSSTANGNSRANVALRASVIMAGVAIVLLGALLVRSHRQRRQPNARALDHATTATSVSHVATRDEKMDTEAAAADSTIPVVPATPIRSPRRAEAQEVSSSPPRPPPRTPSRMDDARSLADSESSWTVATEMGDSAALHSVATHPSQALVSTESFEHDRQVYLQKDMLTTAWSGNNAVAGPVLSESVLQPSHFTAAQGRRRSWVDTDESPRPFIFASHDDTDVGEEVFLMPEEKGDEML